MNWISAGKRNLEENTAFVQIENLPEYKLCLLKKGIDFGVVMPQSHGNPAHLREYTLPARDNMPHLPGTSLPACGWTA